MDNINLILEKYWGFKTFRPLQADIINAVLDGNDALALLPTGGGKSICFQVPALAKEGICVVVSPLIALIKDQVENLQKRQIPAIGLYSGMSAREIDIGLDNCVYGNIKFLYISPERLITDIFRLRLEKMGVNLFAVDEAHCISQWGYDFRPPYLQIAEVLEIIPHVPVLALTASATMPVRDDIVKHLQLKSPKIFTQSFKRENLSYVVYKREDKLNKILDILDKVKGTGIIYVRNRKKTKEIAEMLGQHKISADFYHAGVLAKQRAWKQDKWISDKTRVIVATNAFGMGIDKPDVRTVLHIDIPENLEAYYQEAGRGGRDGKRSFAVMLYNDADIIEMRKRVTENYPDEEDVLNVYQALHNRFKVALGAGVEETYPLNVATFCRDFKLLPIKTMQAIKILEQQGILSLSDSFFEPSHVMMLVDANQVKQAQQNNPALAPLIELLLRSKAGVFSEPVTLDEESLAKQLNVSKDVVLRNLQYLHSLSIIQYQQQTDEPMITLLMPRVPVQDVPINRVLIKERRKHYIDQLKAMAGYINNQHICRSRYLTSYFGDKDEENCGRCDICIRDKRAGLAAKEFENIKVEIQQALNVEALPLGQVVKRLNGHQEEKVLKTLEWLLDNELVFRDEKDFLTIRP